MALTTKYFNTTVTATVGTSARAGYNLINSSSAGATSTLYIVPSGRNAKVKLIYASLSINPTGVLIYAQGGYSGSGSTNASAFLNIGGAANLSTGATYNAYSQYYNAGGSIGWTGNGGSTTTGNFAANANAPISISNYEVKGYASINVSTAPGFGYAQPLPVVPQGYILAGSGQSVNSSSTTPLPGYTAYLNRSEKYFSFIPQNFFLTSGQSVDVTAVANLNYSVSYGSLYNSSTVAIASVAILVIEEAAN
jgi:hypothetical protein